MSLKKKIRNIVQSVNWVQIIILAVLLLANSPLFAALGAVEELPKIQLSKAGEIRAVVELPDGSKIVGGSFSRIGAKDQRCIARIRVDGTVDGDWDPKMKGSYPCVNTLLLSGNFLYVGGGFYHVGGIYRRGICRLDVATGKVDPGWYPVADDDNSLRMVSSMLMTTAGDEIFIGGNFEKLGKDIQAVAKVSTVTGDVDQNWNPGMADKSSVSAMFLSGNNLYIGGYFTEISGVIRNYIAKLSAVGTGALDMVWNPGADSIVTSLVMSEHGDKLYAGGHFKNMGGVSRKGIARLDSAGSGQVDAWNPQPVGAPGFIASISTLSLAGTHLYAGGHYAEIGGQIRSNIARLSISDATADAMWDPDINKRVWTLLPSADGNSIHVGGQFYKTGAEDTLSFSTIDTTTGDLISGFNDLNIGDIGAVLALTRNGNDVYFGGDFVRLNGQPQFFLGKMNTATGQVLDWGTEFNNSVYSLAVSSDGSALYVGGDFTGVDGLSRNRIARLSADTGTPETDWNPDVSSPVRVLLLDDNDLYVGGLFYSIEGVERHRIARLSADTGVLDAGWNPDANNGVFTLALSGSDLYVGGIFTTIGGELRDRLAKVNTLTGVVQPTWVADANSTVRTLLLKDNTLFVGGHFTQINGSVRNRIAKLNATSAEVDAIWNPNAISDVFSLALSEDGNDLYLGGWFSSIGGVDRRKIAKVAVSSGILDPEWNPSVSSGSEVSALLTADAGVYAGGEFSEIGGKTTALGHIVGGHLLTVVVTTASYQAREGVITSVPEGIKCSPQTGSQACERALVAYDYILTADSSNPELTVTQEWLSGCDLAGGTTSTCGVSLNDDRTVEVKLTCELYDFLPSDEPVIDSMSITCNSIKATKGFEIGNGGRVMFYVSNYAELGPGFRVSDKLRYFRVTTP